MQVTWGQRFSERDKVLSSQKLKLKIIKGQRDRKVIKDKKGMLSAQNKLEVNTIKE